MTNSTTTVKAFSLFGATGAMEEILPVPTLPIGCKIYCYGMGMSEREGAIISECDANGSYKAVYISNYESGFFTLDKYARPHSKKFGIGHYFDDNLETFEDEVLEEYILKAGIAKNLRDQAQNQQENVDNEEKKNLPVLYPHLLVNHQDDQATTKKNLVAELKNKFPKVKFSVKKEYYNTYNVSWTNGPTQEEVSLVVDKFEGYVNDITGDFRDFSPSNFNRVFGSFKYVFARRELDLDLTELLSNLVALEGETAKAYPNQTQELLYKILRQTSFAAGAVVTGIEQKSNYSGSHEGMYTILFESSKTTEESKKEVVIVSGLELVQYSDKAVAVFGDTKAVKDALKALGGRFNPALTHNGEKKCGWIFSKTKEAEIKSNFNFN